MELSDLRVRFKDASGLIHAVNGVDLQIRPGERIGLVGESGSGKTVTSLAALGLLPDSAQISGSIRLGGQEVTELSERELRSLRGSHVAMIFQDPMTSLNPVLSIGRQLTETLLTHVTHDRRVATTRASELLDQVGIPDPRRQLRAYPHQLSGGMRQRVMIAIALAGEPKLLVADEPTTALDVTIQAQILDLLTTIIDARDTALLLITHDLGVVAGTCDTAHVMYAGRIVEQGRVDELFAAPGHPYTRGLIDSIPTPKRPRKSRLTPIPGRPPQLRGEPAACAFAPRCPRRQDDCLEQRPLLKTRSAHQPEIRRQLFAPEPASHQMACFHPVEAAQS
jgi:oligopeptide/dipeptide ABC transporter ATP-binding protein